MELAHQRRITILAAVVGALVVGWETANGDLLIPGLVALVFGLALVRRWVNVELDALIAGLVMIGYLVGNRGFAQLHAPNFLLLPGEFALVIGLAVMAWHCAHAKILPFRTDLLNCLILVWLAFGLARLRFDMKAYGTMALRDFAIVYYALFFFLAQQWTGRATQWVERCLDVGLALCPPVFLAFTWWPEPLEHVVVFGTPLIFVKSDVAGGFMAAGVFWFVERYTARRHVRDLVFAAANMTGIALSNSRAAFVALVITTLWLTIRRDWRRLRPVLALGAAGLLVLLSASVLSRQPWEKTFAYRLYQSAASTLDIGGTGRYVSELADKPDNNTFRVTWWRTLTSDTLDRAPLTGLGFGYDLADEFLQVYYPGDTEDFNARSPHSFVITVFARMGAIGLALLFGILAVAVVRMWRVGRGADREEIPALPLWLGAFAIFVSACFGVVLEGPMGAMVFWTFLGLANRRTADATAASAMAHGAIPAPATATPASPIGAAPVTASAETR